jgi:hypothetical protein
MLSLVIHVIAVCSVVYNFTTDGLIALAYPTSKTGPKYFHFLTLSICPIYIVICIYTSWIIWAYARKIKNDVLDGVLIMNLENLSTLREELDEQELMDGNPAMSKPSLDSFPIYRVLNDYASDDRDMDSSPVGRDVRSVKSK